MQCIDLSRQPSAPQRNQPTFPRYCLPCLCPLAPSVCGPGHRRHRAVGRPGDAEAAPGRPVARSSAALVCVCTKDDTHPSTHSRCHPPTLTPIHPHTPTHPTNHSSTHPPTIHLPTHPPTHHPTFHLPTHPPTHPPTSQPNAAKHQHGYSLWPTVHMSTRGPPLPSPPRPLHHRLRV